LRSARARPWPIVGRDAELADVVPADGSVKQRLCLVVTIEQMPRANREPQSEP
jgi:hypothetical protein